MAGNKAMPKPTEPLVTEKDVTSSKVCGIDNWDQLIPDGKAEFLGKECVKTTTKTKEYRRWPAVTCYSRYYFD